MRNFFLLYFIFFGLFFAHRLKAGSLYGSLGGGYTQQNLYYNQSDNTQTTNDAFLSLGYNDYLYSPNLLSHSLAASFRKSNVVSQSQDADTRAENETQLENYNANLHFIPKTKIPFIITASKNYTPLWSLQGDETIFTESKVEQEGISGSINLNMFDISYNADQRRTSSADLVSRNERKDLSKRINVSKMLKYSSYSFGYSKSDQQSQRSSDTLYGDTSWRDTTENTNAGYRWRNEKNTLRFDASASQRRSEDIDLVNQNGMANLSWRPSKKIQTEFNLNADRIIYGGEAFDNMLFSQTTGYMINEKVNISQNYTYSSTLYSQNSALGLGSGYRENLDETLILNLNASFNRALVHFVERDINATSSAAKTDSYTLGAGLNKSFTFLDSKTFLNGTYSDRLSDSGEMSKRNAIQGRLNSQLYRSVSYDFNVIYSKEASRLRLLTQNQGLYDRSVEVVTYSNAISFVTNVNINGRFTSNIGTRQSESSTENQLTGKSKFVTIQHYATIKFDYRLWRTLIFHSFIKAQQDPTYDLTNYSGNMGLNYSYRRMSASLAYTQAAQIGELLDARQNTINFTLMRTF